MKKLLLVPLVALALAPIATAAPGNTVTITASKTGLMYMQKTVHAKAGKVTLVFENPSMLKHDVRIEVGEKEYGGTKQIAHGTTSVILNLKKGTYHFYCSVPGHEDAGMSGTLIVS